MNTPILDEINNELKKYPKLVVQTGIFSECLTIRCLTGQSPASFDTIQGVVYIINGDSIIIKNESVDKRRKKRFKFENYSSISELVRDLVEYQKISLSKKYCRGTLHTIINNWSNSKIHDYIEEMHMGKIVDTF